MKTFKLKKITKSYSIFMPKENSYIPNNISFHIKSNSIKKIRNQKKAKN